jgi:predicted dithiol-disulfide oxidoreductase (DUF899 family)
MSTGLEHITGSLRPASTGKLDGLWGMYQWLDRAPKGRNETGVWRRRHDEYRKGRTKSWSSCRV